MNVYKIKQMYDLSKELECDIDMFKHHVKAREDAQDIIKCVSEALNLPYVEKKALHDNKNRWFVIEVNNFKFTVFFELSEEEQEAFQPRVTV